MTKPIPTAYTTRFFQLITTRQFAEAERILERVKQKMHVTERNRGYFQALYGMLLTQKNNDDRYAFLSSTDLTNKKLLKHYRHEFLSHVNSRLHGEYDRGFFEAWADYMRILPKLDASAAPANNKEVAESEEEKRAEPVEAKTVEAGAEAEQKYQAEGEEKETNAEEPKKNDSLNPGKSGQSTLVDFAK